MTTRADLVAEAYSWIKPATPWQHNQSCKGVGSDCIGFLVGVARAFGLAHDWTRNGREFHGYSPEPDPAKLLQACKAFFDPLPLSQIEPGDILLFRLPKDPKHFGIISSVEPLKIIHAFKTAERVTEMPIDAVWRKRIHSAWRYRGI